MTEYKYWKWTNNKNNDGVSKSKRADKLEKVNKTFWKKVRKGVTEDVVPCEALDNLTEKKAPPQIIDFVVAHREPSDRRSVCNERISCRYMVIQTPINPFLSGSDYIDDLKVQDTLLRPKDSNIKEVE